MASTTQIIFFALFTLCSLFTSTQADHGEQSNVTELDEASSDREGKGIERSCHCEGKQCRCCAKIDIKKIKLRKDGCISLTYMPEQWAVAAKVTVGNRAVFEDTFSARSPPSLCFGIPGLPKQAELCVKFYDMDIEDYMLHACLKLKAKLFGLNVGEIKFGCFIARV